MMEFQEHYCGVRGNTFKETEGEILFSSSEAFSVFLLDSYEWHVLRYKSVAAKALPLDHHVLFDDRIVFNIRSILEVLFVCQKLWKKYQTAPEYDN